MMLHTKKILSLLISAVMVLTLLPTAAFAADGDVAIDEEHFPDANFRAYVKDNFDKDDNDGILTADEIAAIKLIDCNGLNKSNEQKIADLTGIEYFTDLTDLNCSYNQLESLDVSANAELEKLDCSNNQLKTLNLSQNTALTELYCSVNQLESLDVSANTALTYLDCSYNQLTSLDVSANTALTDLSCFNNPLEKLDVSNNTDLTRLYCTNTPMEKLDVSNNTALTVLYCSNNQLKTLNLSQNTALTELYCSNNQLTSLDVSNNTALIQLNCTNNQRTVANRTDLSAIDSKFDEKNVESGSVEGGNFKGGKVNFNPDSENITYIYNCGNGLAASFTLIKGTEDKTLTIDEEHFPDANFRAYVKDNFDKDDNGILTADEIAAIKAIDCNGENKSNEQRIADLTGIEYFTALTDLNCSYNQLESLDVSANVELEKLGCSYNQLKTLDVSANTALTKLSCSYNQLESLDVSANTALTVLHCYNDQLKSLDVSKNTELTVLWCDINQLKMLDVSKNTKLTNLNCTDNQLISLDVSKNTELTRLDCALNHLTSLDVSKNTKLTDLFCIDNHRTVANGTDLSAMDPKFDEKNVESGSAEGGNFKGDKVNFNTDSNNITYTYNCGNGFAVPFILIKGTEDKTLTGIEITTLPTKTAYVAGENFDPAGMVVTAHYKDKTSKVVEGWSVIGGENLAVGTESVTISYKEKDVEKTVTQSITVTAAPVEEKYPIHVEFMKIGLFFSRPISMTVEPDGSIQAPNANSFFQRDRCWKCEDGKLFVESGGTITYAQLLEVLGNPAQEGDVIRFVTAREEEWPEPQMQTVRVYFVDHSEQVGEPAVLEIPAEAKFVTADLVAQYLPEGYTFEEVNQEYAIENGTVQIPVISGQPEEPTEGTITVNFRLNGFGQRLKETNTKTMTVTLNPGEVVTAPYAKGFFDRTRSVTWKNENGDVIKSGESINYEELAEALGGTVPEEGTNITFTGSAKLFG